MVLNFSILLEWMNTGWSIMMILGRTRILFFFHVHVFPWYKIHHFNILDFPTVRPSKIYKVFNNKVFKLMLRDQFWALIGWFSRSANLIGQECHLTSINLKRLLRAKISNRVSTLVFPITFLFLFDFNFDQSAFIISFFTSDNHSREQIIWSESLGSLIKGSEPGLLDISSNRIDRKWNFRKSWFIP